MALVWKDRVLETTTTTGTGTLTLAGAVTGYQTWAAIGTGNTAYYCLYAVDNFGNPSGVWEVGLGTYTASGTTLARTTVYANSSGTQVALDLAAGTKRVMLTAAAQHFTSSGLTVGTTAIASGTSGRLLYDAAGTLGETAAVTYSTSTPNLTVTASGAAVVPLVVKGATSQTANLTEWQNSAGTVGVRINDYGEIDYPGRGSGTNNLLLGKTVGRALTTGDYNVAIGTGSGAGLTSGNGNVLISAAGVITGEGNVAIKGGFAATNTTDAFSLGNQAVANTNAVAVGAYAQATAYKSLVIGAAAVASAEGSVVLGWNWTNATVNRLTYATPYDVNNPGTPSFMLVGAVAYNTNRECFLVQTAWADSTDATRKARATLNVYDWSAARECLRLEADGAYGLTSIGGAAVTASTALTVVSPTATYKALVVKAAAGQSADLTEWQDSAGNEIARLTVSGSGGSFALHGEYWGYVSGNLAMLFGAAPSNGSIITDSVAGDLCLRARLGNTLIGADSAIAVKIVSATSSVEQWKLTTTSQRAVSAITPAWVDNTDATRKGRLTLSAYDTAARECLRLEASGSAAMLGLYGTAATVQYATTGTVTGHTGGGGTALTHSDTFTGNTGATAYTLGDVVRALKLLGVIAS